MKETVSCSAEKWMKWGHRNKGKTEIVNPRRDGEGFLRFSSSIMLTSELFVTGRKINSCELPQAKMGNFINGIKTSGWASVKVWSRTQIFFQHLVFLPFLDSTSLKSTTSFWDSLIPNNVKIVASIPADKFKLNYRKKGSKYLFPEDHWIGHCAVPA